MEYLNLPLTAAETNIYLEGRRIISDTDKGYKNFYLLERYENVSLSDIFTRREIALLEDQFDFLIYEHDYEFSIGLIVWMGEYFRCCLEMLLVHPRLKSEDSELIDIIIKKIERLYFYDLDTVH